MSSEPGATDSVERVSVEDLPRLPFKGSIDLTYRCNNRCRHCWLRLPAAALEGKQELGFDEIRRIAGEARAMGCREWSISGGEPMLRPDFPEIFDYLTRKARTYTLNTNGTLITPDIARLLIRRGAKLVALYGATPEVHDHITCTPGSFDAAMRGFRYLKEAGADFTVQLIPMRDNYHEYGDMVKLAKSLSPHCRVGAPWLYLSACGSNQRNAEISRLRLAPKDVVALDEPIPTDEVQGNQREDGCGVAVGEDRLCASCIAHRRDFHVDPYGGLSFCSFVKDPALRCDLRKCSVREGWEEFIPSLADKVRGGREYLENCGHCSLRPDCRWCDVYGYLEHRRHGAKVEYLCSIARETHAFRENWKKNHRRYFGVAEITIQVESDLPITDSTFDRKFEQFRLEQPGDDRVVIRHHFELPDLKGKDLGRQVYRHAPWAIYRKSESWIYLGVSPGGHDGDLHRVVVFNDDHSRAEVYSPDARHYYEGALHSLTMLPTDQILLARLLVQRQGFLVHSAGLVLNGQGLLFVGHSEAGKSTTTKMLMERTDVLCDDRNIVRRMNGRFQVFGTWSHGEVPKVSAASAPLRALLFLRQSSENRLTPITDPSEVRSRLLACLIRPLETADWWEAILPIVAQVAREVPSYEMEFDKSGRIVEQLENLTK